MEANDDRASFTEQSGVRVTVIDEIQLKINRSRGDEVLKEGETVTLYCTVLFPPRTSAECSTFHHLEVTWFRDGHALTQSGPALQLDRLTAKDSGNYTCALKANVHTLSTPFILHVEAGEEGGDGKLPLIVGVVFGALLVLFVIVLVLCIIRRYFNKSVCLLQLVTAGLCFYSLKEMSHLIFRNILMLSERKRAADKHQMAVGAKLEQKRLDDLNCTVLPPSEQQGGHHHQETDRAVEEVSYASVQFKHKNQAR
ncbi:hypothetical protein L3Q82_012869 [Scortum barcoo]|uniref:Uncharacterized protein n=1 Tax=Scortum barcoo TaxID=214431 RepID=A0ACB8VZ32_9TELE|nr:hypothetical protein L3Q82_012869 [Scortum barcoo]